MKGVVRWFRSASVPQRVIVATLAVFFGIVVLASLWRVLEGVFVVALVLLGLAFVAVPFVLLGFAIYGIAQLIKGRDRKPDAGAGAPPAQAAFTDHGPAAPAPGPAPSPAPSTTLPPELGAAVARIRDKARALQAPEQSPLLSADDRQRIESMVGDFLPQALSTYQSLPKGSHDWELDGGGTTPRKVLEQHLKLIEDGLDQIARRVFEAGAAELMAQGRFLEETLRAHRSEELSLNGNGAKHEPARSSS
jgi:hypothetical protein